MHRKPNFILTFLTVVSLLCLSTFLQVNDTYGEDSLGLSSEKISSINNFREKAKESVEKAKTLLSEEKFDLAKSELKGVLAIVNEKISIYEDEAKTLTSKGNKEGARIYYQEASFINRIAEQISKSLKNVNESEVTYRIEQGRAFLRKDEFERAEAEFRRALTLDPGNRNAKNYLQDIEQLKQEQAGRELAEKIEQKIEQGKENIDAGNFEQADADLKEALNLMLRDERRYARRKRQVESLVASIPKLREEYQQQQSEKKSDYYITRGYEYLKAGRLDDAETNFNKALEALPGNRNAKSGLARIKRERQNIRTSRISQLLRKARADIRNDVYDKAETALQEVLKLDPDNRKAKNYLQDVEQLKQEQTERELAEKIEQKIEQGKENIDAGNFEQADADLKEALNLMLRDERRYARRKRQVESLVASIPELRQKKQIKVQAKRKEQKKEEYKDRVESIVAEARERTQELMFNDLIEQGKGYLIDGRFEEAKDKFLEASEIYPGNELASKYLMDTKQAYEQKKTLDKIEGVLLEGEEYLKEGKFDKAEAIFKKALKMSPPQDKREEIQSLLTKVDSMRETVYNKRLQEQADEYIVEGIENLKKSQYTKAKANFEKALIIKPDYSEAQKWLVQVEKAQEEARRHKLQTIVEEGKEYLDNDQFDSARAKFEQVLKIDPQYSEAMYLLNRVTDEETKYGREQQMEKVSMVINEGMEYLEEGDFDKAESAFREAVSITPADMKEQTTEVIEARVNSLIRKGESKRRADEYVTAGIKCLNNKEFDRAEEAFKAALDIMPKYKIAEEYLIRLETRKLQYESKQLSNKIDKMVGSKDSLSKEDESTSEYPPISQLIEQIRNKIQESNKVLKKERI